MRYDNMSTPMKQYIPSLLTALLVSVLFTACSEESPSLRVRNDRQTKANMQIKPAAGNTMNINDVQGGQTTGYISISEGNYVVTATIQSESVSPEIGVTAKNDMNYTVVVANTTPPTLRVESEEK